ncbi:MAG: GumC family protein [Planctomycetaceae bacterium]
MVLVPAVVIFAATTIFVTLQPDVYEGQVVMMGPMVRTSTEIAGEGHEASTRDVLRSAHEYLMGTRLLKQIIDEFDPYPEVRPEGDLALIEELRGNLIVDVDQASGAITLLFRHREGERPSELAAQVVNRLAELFVSSQREALSDTATQNVTFLERQETELRSKLEKAERALEAFRNEHKGELPEDVTGNQMQILTLTNKIDDLRRSQARNRDEIDRYTMSSFELDQRLSLARDMAPRSGDRVLEFAVESLNVLEQQRVQDLVRYGEESRHIQTLDAQIAGVRERIEKIRATSSGKDQVEEYYRYMQDLYRTRQEELRADNGRLDQVAQATEQLMRELRHKIEMAATLEAVYSSLKRNVTDAEERRKILQARVEAAKYALKRQEFNPITPVQIEQRAFPASRPAGPNRLVIALLGLAVGTAVGVALVVARRRLDVSYHDTSDLRALLPGAVLVSVPEVSKLTRRLPRMMFGVTAGMLLLGLFVATLVLLGTQVGWFQLPEVLQAVRGLR